MGIQFRLPQFTFNSLPQVRINVMFGPLSRLVQDAVSIVKVSGQITLPQSVGPDQGSGMPLP